MNLPGGQRYVRGAVLFLLADTLAAHDLGGFKIGVGFALRKCRMCMAAAPKIAQKVTQSVKYYSNSLQ